jgi:hypothetical protein
VVEDGKGVCPWVRRIGKVAGMKLLSNAVNDVGPRGDRADSVVELEARSPLDVIHASKIASLASFAPIVSPRVGTLSCAAVDVNGEVRARTTWGDGIGVEEVVAN